MTGRSDFDDMLALIAECCSQSGNVDDLCEKLIEDKGGDIFKFNVIHRHGETRICGDPGKACKLYGIMLRISPDNLNKLFDEAYQAFVDTFQKGIEKYSDRDL